MPMPPDFKVPRERGELGRLPVAANVQFGQNSIVFRDAAGRAVPWSADAALVPLGVAVKPFDNEAGAAGAFEVEYLEAGAFGFPISEDDPVTTAEVSTLVFVADPNLITPHMGAAPLKLHPQRLYGVAGRVRASSNFISAYLACRDTALNRVAHTLLDQMPVEGEQEAVGPFPGRLS